MNIVGIPSIGRSPVFADLLDRLLNEDQVDMIYVTVNMPHVILGLPVDPRVKRVNVRGPGIHPGWNYVLDKGREQDAYVALLNDDIVFPEPNSVGRMAALLRQHPRYTALGFNYEPPVKPKGIRTCQGSYRHHGIGGFAYMVNARRCPEVDERFEWWGGDDDLFERIKRSGGLMGISNGIPVQHPAGGGTSTVGQSWIPDAIGRDRLRYVDLYGESAAW